MFRRVLVPVDFTDKNRAALSLAAGLVAEGGEITLLHVIETISDVPFGELEDFYGRIEERSRRAMEELAATLEAETFRLQREIAYGKRVREIVAWAESRESELVVVTAPRLEREQAREEWIGLGHAVAVLAPCPVLLVR